MRTDAARRAVKKATKLPNAPSSLEALPVKPHTKDGSPMTIEHCWFTHMPDEKLAWAFELFETNMRKMYEDSQDGYDSERAKYKRDEMSATTSRYLFASVEGKPIAFCHYRFDMDDGEPVVYCYELQVDAKYQKQGVGAILLDVLEKMGRKLGLTKVMATVFTHNTNSRAFFSRCGFVEDETSPKPELEVDYIIVSRSCNADGEKEQENKQ